MSTHLEDVAEQADTCPLFVMQGKSRYLAPLVGIDFLRPKAKDELVDRLV